MTYYRKIDLDTMINIPLQACLPSECLPRPITPGYVDDVNAMIPLKDVEFFLASFRSHAGPLGAVLNAQKTRILTSTSGTSILPRLRAAQPLVALP